jgi:hypothetical protein
VAKAKEKAEPKKGKGKKGAAAEDPSTARIVRINAHPRARHQIALAKGWAGLSGFGIALLLSLQAAVPPFDAGMRALVAGIALYLFAWAAALAVWRHVAVAEVAAAQRRLEEAHRRSPDEPGVTVG